MLLAVILGAGLVIRENCLVYGRDIEKPVVIVCLSLFFFVAAFRANSVGADTYNYEQIYIAAGNCSIKEFFSNPSLLPYYLQNIEAGYFLYNHLLYMLCPVPQFITLFNSFLLIFFAGRFFLRESPSPWLSTVAFLCLGVFQTGLNMTPSMIAAFAVMSCVGMLHHRQDLRFVIIVIFFAFIFHASALVFLLLIGVSRIKLSRKQLLVSLLLVSVVVLLGWRYVVQILSPLVAILGYEIYLESSALRLEQLFVFLQFFIVLVSCWYFTEEKDESHQADNIGNWIFLFLSGSYIAALHISSFARLAMLFMPHYLTLVPNLLNSIKMERGINRRHHLCVDSRERAILIILIFLVTSFMARLLVNNIGMTMPYLFCWD